MKKALRYAGLGLLGLTAGVLIGGCLMIEVAYQLTGVTRRPPPPPKAPEGS